jgi:hypothetical protein
MRRIIAKLDRFFCGYWRIGVLDLDKGIWISSPDHIAYLKTQNGQGRHILIQPDQNVEPFYLLADDLTTTLLKKHHQYPDGAWRPGRMVIETSTDNYQVWIHSSRSLSILEKQHWLKIMHSDPGANPHRRWGRHPGFFNRKEKYRSDSGRYPLSKLIWVDWRYFAHIPHIPHFINNQKTTPVTCERNPLNRYTSVRRMDYDRGNDSATDFAYALALIRRNYSQDHVIQCIFNERTDWKNHSGQKRIKAYLNRTVEKAWKIIHNHTVNDA